MDIIPQTFLNTAVLLYGLVLLMPILSGYNIALLTGFGWFAGWGIIGITSTILVILGVVVSPLKLFLIVISFLVIVWTYNLRIGKHSSLRNLNLKVLWWIPVFALGFYFLAQNLNYMHYSTDAIQNEGLSRIFHVFGVYVDDKSKVFYLLFNYRLPFFVAVHNLAYQLGIKIYYSFLSITSIMMIVAFMGCWILTGRGRSYFGRLLLLMGACLFFSNRLILLHSFYSLSNLTTMAYFSAGTLCLWMYLFKERDCWFLLACLFLGVTGIVRKEMLVFSLLPFVYVFFRIKLRRLLIYTGFVIYAMCAYLWFVWGCFLVGFENHPQRRNRWPPWRFRHNLFVFNYDNSIIFIPLVKNHGLSQNRFGCCCLSFFCCRFFSPSYHATVWI